MAPCRVSQTGRLLPKSQSICGTTTKESLQRTNGTGTWLDTYVVTACRMVHRQLVQRTLLS